MKLIDKDALVAEIDKQIELGKLKCQQLQENNDRESYIAWSELLGTCEQVLSFLDTIEVKEVDLEEEIDEWYNREAPKEFENVYYYDIEKCAQYFFELGLKAQKGVK